MAVGKDNIIINVEIDVEVKELLKTLSDKLEISVSSLANNLILISLHEFGILEKVGLLFLLSNLKKFLEQGLNIQLKGHPKSYSTNTDFISVTIKKETKERLDKFANEFDIPFKKLARNFIYTTLDDYNLLPDNGLKKIAFRFKKLITSDQEFEKLHEKG